MPVNNASFRSGVPASRRLLERAMGVGPLREFLDPLAFRDVVELRDDFHKLDSGIWTSAASTGGTAAAADGSDIGTITGSTGATTNNVVVVHGPTIALPSRNVRMEARLKVSDVASVTLEAGLQEPQTDERTVAITTFSVTTPAINTGITDAALVAFKAGVNNGDFHLFTKGSGTGQATYARQIVGSAPASGTYVTVSLHVIGSSAVVAIVNGSLTEVIDLGTDSDGVINAAVALRPVIRLQTLAAANRSVTVDYIRVWQDR